jgi:KUP system potassium uptake protein
LELLLSFIPVIFFSTFGTQVIESIWSHYDNLVYNVISFGMKEIMQHVDILTALNPYYAYDLLIIPTVLAARSFLCTTGAEALYSDLGHCGIKNIRITWVYEKSLVVAYLGQALG